jgi:hypothetical protein
MSRRKLKVQFKHYALQTVLTVLGVGTASAIVFTFITIIKEVI